MPLSVRLLIVRLDYADVRQCAVMFLKIEAVSDNPLITDAEAEIVDIDMHFSLLLFVQQRAGLNRCRTARFKHLDQVMNSLPGVENWGEVAPYLSSYHGPYVNVAMVGGSVRAIADDIDRKIYKALMSPAGEELINKLP